MVKIAIIGGTGLENPEILKKPRKIDIPTPFGQTSSIFRSGKIEGKDVLILSRHGNNHTIPPSQVNNLANLWAIRESGCTHILATTACGSLREEIMRGDLVIPDQFIDFTRSRKTTFYEQFQEGKLNHTPMADPFNLKLREILIQSAMELGIRHHPRGTVVTIEGPRFSTRAESIMFRLLGADVINMSTAPECILSNELGIPYAVLAMSTDYDSWKTDEKPVTWEQVLAVFRQNVENVINLMVKAISHL